MFKNFFNRIVPPRFGNYWNKVKSSKNFIGKKPLFFQIDWLSSLEIKQSKDINIYNSFFQSNISEY